MSSETQELIHLYETLPQAERAEVADFARFLSSRHGTKSGAGDAAGAIIQHTPGVVGGDAHVRDTRIAVSTLVQLKKLGRTETQLLADFPGLMPNDLDAVWSYYRTHRRDRGRDRCRGAGGLTLVARLYSKENFPQPVVEELRQLGHDVLTSLDAGQANQSIPDDQVIRFATGQGRAILTLNRRHFHAQHQLSAEHAGIITCTIDADYRTLAARIHDRLLATPSLNGQLVKITRPST